MQPLVVIDVSDVVEGKLEEVRAAIRELAAFVEANEPEPIAYWVYLSEDDTRMTVLQVHPDSASMEYHMKAGAAAFAKFKGLITMSSMDVYGTPSEELLDLLQQKARMLGTPRVGVHPAHAGFSRFAPP
jgi:quinol monooxygenase YgiN